MCKSKLNQKINTVNKRYLAGLNDDDQVSRMIAEDRKTKGYTFFPQYDTYELITDEEKLNRYVEKYGYWSEAVKEFNSILIMKGGDLYMQELNSKHIGTSNVKP